MIAQSRMPLLRFPSPIRFTTHERLYAMRLILLLGLLLFSSREIFAQETASLQLTVIQIPNPASRPLFQVQLHNAGKHDMALNLGIMLGNGRMQYADNIHFLLGDSHGKVLHLAMIAPAIVAGRMDPMVVPLPVGSTFALPVDLKDYGAPDEKVFETNLAGGRYTLRATYAGVAAPRQGTNSDMLGITFMPFWTGTVSSSALPFTITQKAKPRGSQ